jgi:hypothetical protein
LTIDTQRAGQAVSLLRGLGYGRVGLAGLNGAQGVAEAGADGWFDAADPTQAPEFDALVLPEAETFALLMRRLEPVMARDIAIVPADPAWVVEPSLRDADATFAAWNTAPDANYLARTAQRGHYLEFGTFWGRSFFPAYYRLRHWLDGKFFAFDSFRGISTPLADETAFTGGDFTEGAYFCNLKSFQAIAALAQVPAERMTTVPGFYADSLVGHHPSEYGLEPKSVSICIIDCDLYEPTKQVLEFITPLLDDGALIYFDDWRLCRGSSKVGERAAALEWLAAHPDFELIDFPGDAPVTTWSWQHAWFIFQRR